MEIERREFEFAVSPLRMTPFQTVPAPWPRIFSVRVVNAESFCQLT